MQRSVLCKQQRMQAVKKQQQFWKVNIQARAQNFNFNLKAIKILPRGKFQRFSVLVRLHKFILKLKFKSGSTVSVSPHQKRILKSTFLRLLQKLRLRPAKKTISFQHPDLKSALKQWKQFGNKKSIWAGTLVFVILALLLQSFSKKDPAFWVALNLGKGYVFEYVWNWIQRS